MSSIIFEGNTYTFGATVSANPGTGTTSYVFGGLSSGSTFGFILRAFNGFGFSNFIGPVIKFTESMIEESREIIGALAWTWEGNDNQEFQYFSGSTLNMFYDSENFGATWWDYPGYTRSQFAELTPIGTTGWLIQAQPGYQFISQSPILESGSTYMISWYQHTGSSAGLLFQIYTITGVPGDPFGLPMQQILPQVGIGVTSSTAMSLLGPTGGQTGWIRYAVQVYVVGSSRYFYTPFRLNDSIPGSRGFILASPQLEKVT